ncbi:MAG: DUF4097 family beta strand repeat-containing protein [Gammaproteobacteria bacterium]
MFRILRFPAVVVLVALPMLALARPPLIYHQTVNMTANQGANVKLMLGSPDVQIAVKPVKSVTVTVDIWANASSKDDKAKIVNRLAPTTSMQGDDVLVRSPENHGSHWSFGWHQSPEVLVSVVMPPSMNVNYRLGSGDFRFDNAGAPTAINGESGSGDVMVHSASKQLVIKAGSGDLDIGQNGNADQAKLTAGSGDVRFEGTVQTLDIHTGSGDMNINAGMHSARLNAGSGDITAHWRNLSQGSSLSADAGSGDVMFYFPDGTALTGRLSTGSGDMESQSPGTLSSEHHVFTLSGGNGAVTLDASTGSGDLILRKGG